jgi:hypothetical protein
VKLCLSSRKLDLKHETWRKMDVDVVLFIAGGFYDSSLLESTGKITDFPTFLHTL